MNFYFKINRLWVIYHLQAWR